MRCYGLKHITFVSGTDDNRKRKRRIIINELVVFTEEAVLFHSKIL